MLTRACAGLDALFARALEAGLLRPDPSLVIVAPPLPPVLEETAEDPLADETQAPTTPGVTVTTFNVQVATPDAGRGAAGRGLGQPGRRRHLGDHHQPRARRNLGDAGDLRRRRRRAAGGAPRAGLERIRW